MAVSKKYIALHNTHHAFCLSERNQNRIDAVPMPQNFALEMILILSDCISHSCK